MGWPPARPLFPLHQSQALGRRQVALEAKPRPPPGPLRHNPALLRKARRCPEDPWAKRLLHLKLDTRHCDEYTKLCKTGPALQELQGKEGNWLPINTSNSGDPCRSVTGPVGIWEKLPEN